MQLLKLLKYSGVTYQGFTLVSVCSFKPIFTHTKLTNFIPLLNTEKLKIWLADDDEDDRQFFEQALSKIDVPFDLKIFTDGEQFLKHFNNSQESPDYVFLDINMPLVNGLECLRAIKCSQPDHPFPIIILSTAFSDSMISQCYSNQASLYVKKPNRFAELVNMISYCLQTTRPSLVAETT
jgi:DNA-binding response OmpR family regulator